MKTSRSTAMARQTSHKRHSRLATLGSQKRCESATLALHQRHMTEDPSASHVTAATYRRKECTGEGEQRTWLKARNLRAVGLWAVTTPLRRSHSVHGRSITGTLGGFWRASIVKHDDKKVHSDSVGQFFWLHVQQKKKNPPPRPLNK